MCYDADSGCESLMHGWTGKPGLKDSRSNNQGLARYWMGGKELAVTCKWWVWVTEQRTALHAEEKELTWVGRSGFPFSPCWAVAEISAAIRRCENRKLRDESFTRKWWLRLYFQRRQARGILLREMRVRTHGNSSSIPGTPIPPLEGKTGRLSDTE